MKMRKPKTIEYNPICDPKHAHGYSAARWVENVSCGLRRVDFADKIARNEGSRSIDHQGWYTYDDGDPYEILRGVVYRLPGRNGKAQFVYGYDDPNNDDCAFLNFEPVETVLEAAKAADRFAEIFAEHERDYHRAWDAGQRCAQWEEEIKDLRSEALAIGREMREARKANLAVPMICAALREKIADNYREIKRLRRKRDELRNDYGHEDAFKEGCHG